MRSQQANWSHLQKLSDQTTRRYDLFKAARKESGKSCSRITTAHCERYTERRDILVFISWLKSVSQERISRQWYVLPH